mgnify:CR=1 FL=1
MSWYQNVNHSDHFFIRVVPKSWSIMMHVAILPNAGAITPW